MAPFELHSQVEATGISFSFSCFLQGVGLDSSDGCHGYQLKTALSVSENLSKFLTHSCSKKFSQLLCLTKRQNMAKSSFTLQHRAQFIFAHGNGRTDSVKLCLLSTSRPCVSTFTMSTVGPRMRHTKIILLLKKK